MFDFFLPIAFSVVTFIFSYSNAPRNLQSRGFINYVNILVIQVCFVLFTSELHHDIYIALVRHAAVDGRPVLGSTKFLSTNYSLPVCRYSDSLRAGRSGDRIPVWTRFSAPVQNGPGAHPASCTIGTGYFPGVKRPGRGVDHPPLLAPRLKKTVELYLYSPSGPSWTVLG